MEENIMSEEENENWLEELASESVGGRFIPSASGLVTIFKLVDPSEKPARVKKDYEGTKSQKDQWNVILHGLSFQKPAYKVVLEDNNPKKLEKIDACEKGKEYILELSRTASKALAQFMLDEKITSEDVIKYLRKGEGFDTEYFFKRA